MLQAYKNIGSQILVLEYYIYKRFNAFEMAFPFIVMQLCLQE